MDLIEFLKKPQHKEWIKLGSDELVLISKIFTIDRMHDFRVIKSSTARHSAIHNLLRLSVPWQNNAYINLVSIYINDYFKLFPDETVSQSQSLREYLNENCVLKGIMWNRDIVYQIADSISNNYNITEKKKWEKEIVIANIMNYIDGLFYNENMILFKILASYRPSLRIIAEHIYNYIIASNKNAGETRSTLETDLDDCLRVFEEIEKQVPRNLYGGLSRYTTKLKFVDMALDLLKKHKRGSFTPKPEPIPVTIPVDMSKDVT